MAAALGIAAPIIVEVRLRERDVGEISGHTREEIEVKWPGLLDQWRRGSLDQMPGGESDITPRVTAALEAVATAPEGSNVLVITHGGVIGAIDRWLGNEYLRVGNVQGRRLVVDDDGRISFDSVFAVDDSDTSSPVAL